MKSYWNLFEMMDGSSSSFTTPSDLRQNRGRRLRSMAGIISNLEIDHGGCESVEEEYKCDYPGMENVKAKTIVVANQLPLRVRKSEGEWVVKWDDVSLYLQLKDGLKKGLGNGSSGGTGSSWGGGSSDGGGEGASSSGGGGDDETEVVYIGCLRDEVLASEQEKVSELLLEKYNCVATFVPNELYTKYYHGFCKQQLWPLFHYMLPLSPDFGGRFDRSLWQAYLVVNKIFADRVMEVINSEDDFVWVHDYHLMLLPTFLRKKFNRIKLGFFLHSPFPSSEIYKTLPVREILLRALLNVDLIGFHTFDYARHFLSCCSRMLGLTYESKRGYIGLEYYGRTVNIKILPVGVHLGQLQSILSLHQTESKVSELIKRYRDQGRIMLLGVDDMDIFKGISLKLLAMEQLLVQHRHLVGKVVLVQIANPARGRGKDVKNVQDEVFSTVKRINDRFGRRGYNPVVLINKPLEFFERVAYYVVAECCLVTAVRDGMNLIPYEYIVSRQGNSELDVVMGLNLDKTAPPVPKRSMLVVSEFIGCSPSLSGAIRVNPWDIDAVAVAMHSALHMSESEKQLRHDKHYRYVSTHDVGYWAKSFIQDLERTCKDHVGRRYCGIGFGLGFRVVALDPNFKKLSVEYIMSAYGRTKHRAILIDYDGILMPGKSMNKRPSSETIGMLNELCRDDNNLVILVSGKGRKTLGEWFSPCEKLGIAAEHGHFLRLQRDGEWETCVLLTDPSWKQIAEPVMKLYTETTDGSTIENNETSLVWSYEEADRDFGSCQAKELLDHLESVLANDPVSVKSGRNVVEVKPQGVSKGLIAQRLLSTLQERGKLADFVICIGDDRSDEDMFEVISNSVEGPSLSPTAQVFACTVGRKPSKAKYYLDDTGEIGRLVKGLASVSKRMLAAVPKQVLASSQED